MITRTLSILALTTTFLSCAPRKQPPPAPVPASVAKPPAEAPNLGGLLARERAGRPAVAPAVEQVAAALERAGLGLSPMKQVLARTVGARYCAAGTTAAGLAVAVCEFGNEADADRGLALSHRTFDALIPGRTLARNRATLLTLTPPAASADGHAQAERVATTFATL
jgi:hypothetical protein